MGHHGQNTWESKLFSCSTCPVYFQVLLEGPHLSLLSWAEFGPALEAKVSNTTPWSSTEWSRIGNSAVTNDFWELLSTDVNKITLCPAYIAGSRPSSDAAADVPYSLELQIWAPDQYWTTIFIKNKMHCEHVSVILGHSGKTCKFILHSCATQLQSVSKPEILPHLSESNKSDLCAKVLPEIG